MKWLRIAVLSVVALVGVVLLVGSLLPADHVAATRMRIDPPREVRTHPEPRGGPEG